MSPFAPLVTWLHRLTEPAASIQDPQKRLSARLLAIVTLGLVFIIGFSSILSKLLGAETQTYVLGLGAAVFTVILYGLSRTRHYQLVGVGLVAMDFVTITFMTLFAEHTPFVVTQYVMFLVLSMLLANALFRARWTIMVACLSLLLTWIFWSALCCLPRTWPPST